MTATLTAPPPAPAPTAPVVPQFQATSQEKGNFANQLRQQTLAVRLMQAKLGVRKALTKDQLEQAADEFHADRDFLGASKKLLDTRHPKYKAVTAIRGRAKDFWRLNTTPYPEPGVRLIRKDKVQQFSAEMNKLKAELKAAAADLQMEYPELQEQARTRLGDLFNAADYPARIDREFDLDWDFPSIEPPEYLKNIHPELYEQEQKRIAARFEEAVALAEAAFAEQFQKLVAHLVERLKGGEDGKPKTFRDTAVKNLTDFFEQFRQLDVGSNGTLQALVTQAQQVVQGISPDDLRNQDNLRASVTTQLNQVQQALDAMIVAKPGRAINLTDEE